MGITKIVITGGPCAGKRPREPAGDRRGRGVGGVALRRARKDPGAERGGRRPHCGAGTARDAGGSAGRGTAGGHGDGVFRRDGTWFLAGDGGFGGAAHDHAPGI